MMEKFLDLSTLEERLQDTESIAMEYCSSSGSWHLGRFIVKKRNEKGKVINVLYVVRQIDQQNNRRLNISKDYWILQRKPGVPILQKLIFCVG